MIILRSVLLLLLCVVTASAQSQRGEIGEFAASPAAVSQEDAAKQLALLFPIVESIKTRFPDLYFKLNEYWFIGLSKGKTSDELTDNIRLMIRQIVQKLAKYADDDVLVRYNELVADHYEQLGVKDPRLCHSYAAGVETRPPSLTGYFSDATVQRELVLTGQIIETARERPLPSPEFIKPLWQKVAEMTKQKGLSDSDRAMLNQPEAVPENKYGRFCEALTIMLREIGKLPSAEAAAVFRSAVK